MDITVERSLTDLERRASSISAAWTTYEYVEDGRGGLPQFFAQTYWDGDLPEMVSKSEMRSRWLPVILYVLCPFWFLHEFGVVGFLFGSVLTISALAGTIIGTRVMGTRPINGNLYFDTEGKKRNTNNGVARVVFPKMREQFEEVMGLGVQTARTIHASAADRSMPEQERRQAHEDLKNELLGFAQETFSASETEIRRCIIIIDGEERDAIAVRRLKTTLDTIDNIIGSSGDATPR